jgi:hypothetical protein
VRALLAACVVMGVLIVAGLAVLVVAVAGRTPPPPTGAAPATVLLDEPAGTRIAAASGTVDSVVLLLTGAGPDRVVAVDPHSGRVQVRVRLAR